ncbi:MAG TPA: type II toxin-antitoxin system HigB family toxin [Terriglobales bacterium]|nr:type II toxin-antitoxin system HigB family toxin [Terriglobales bacterium]
MRVISRKALRDAEQKHGDLAGVLDVWYKIAKKAKWSCLNDIRATWRDTDEVGGVTIFNVKGNKYRLLARVNYKSQLIFIRSVLTHAEYDKEDWRK